MQLFIRLLATTIFLNLTINTTASAADQAARYNQIHFQVERSRPVDNDRMQAMLSITAEDDSTAQLANQINRAMDWALKTAKARSKVTARSGDYRTNPVYDKEKIRRWRATQELFLESRDFTELGSLIGVLQERLQVASITFSVSDERQLLLEDELITQALDAFKQRAELVRKQFSAKGYRIVDIAINTGGPQPVPQMRAYAMAKADIAAPALEAGTSSVSATVSGVIELE